jgi:hypothetical protein
MTDQQWGLLVLFGLCVACSAAAHLLIRRYWAAAAAAAAAVAVLFQAFARATWDHMFLYAWATGVVAGLAVALAVGAAFRHLRRRGTAGPRPA